MRLGPVIERDKKNKKMSKKFDDDVILADCDVIAIFPIHGQFGAIRRPDWGCIVCNY